MSNHHQVTNQLVSIGGERLFTESGWNQVISPRIDRMPTEGGCLAIILDFAPDRRNYAEPSVATFTGQERKAIKTAILRARKRREAQCEG